MQSGISLDNKVDMDFNVSSRYGRQYLRALPTSQALSGDSLGQPGMITWDGETFQVLPL